MENKKYMRGFSLVELSVAIVILGFALYSAMAIFAERSAIDKVAVTERKMDEIEKAIRIYFKENGDLPCVADGELALDVAGFAVENCAVDNFSIGTIAGGSVPARTLNLSDDYVFDGWGKRISYYVSDNNTDGNWADGDITINDVASPTPNPITTAATYVLISHGENGIGAWNRNGSVLRVVRSATTSAGERDNAHVATDGDYEAADNVFTDTIINDTDNVATADYFDDIVRWKTKEMIDYDEDRLP